MHILCAKKKCHLKNERMRQNDGSTCNASTETHYKLTVKYTWLPMLLLRVYLNETSQTGSRMLILEMGFKKLIEPRDGQLVTLWCQDSQKLHQQCKQLLKIGMMLTAHQGRCFVASGHMYLSRVIGKHFLTNELCSY